MLTAKFIEKEINYDGSQLSPHYIYTNFDILGNAVISFAGKCDVKLDKMVDLADVKENASIYSEKMLHFIAEFFDNNLVKSIYRQRLFICVIKEIIENRIGDCKITRSGDDLYIDDKKLTVSIATVSPVSSLIHTGINISSKKTPVKTISLEDLGLDYRDIANKILEVFKEEEKGIYAAKCKVKPVY
ncbi:MAG: DUF366 family protein [Armatimonadota bacterium]